MRKFTELETVILKHDIKEQGLLAGDMGAVVHVYGKGEAAEVEFVTATGRTIALVMLKLADVRSALNKDVLHIRNFASA
ncbi:DUF4926 domain-containing protein [Candidatus Microgenomates bacterium]|nr:DUF4926 domain-containing protein [Candidatus Microgenomates bacterium]